MTNTAKTDNFGLTHENRMDAYAAVKERYGLKATQRDQLDASLSYSLIMFYAHSEAWTHVQYFLRQEGIIS
jgi:glycine betaine/choline ABC-type transport system substrate-binding protein